MSRKPSNPTDLVAGSIFATLGLSVVGIASFYPIGTADQMGPGYFPIVLGLCLAALGAAIAGSAWFSEPVEAAPTSLRALMVITASVVMFALLLPKLGLMATIVVVTLASSFARPNPDLKLAAMAGIGLAVACYLIFALGLDLRIRIWPWFIA